MEPYSTSLLIGADGFCATSCATRAPWLHPSSTAGLPVSFATHFRTVLTSPTHLCGVTTPDASCGVPPNPRKSMAYGMY